MAQIVSGVGRVPVGLVLPVGDAVFRGVVFNCCPGDLQQGADDPAPSGRNAAEPVQSAAPQQVEQQRLAVIIGVVGRCDIVRSRPVRRILQKSIAQDAGGLFHRQSLRPGAGGHVSPADLAGDLMVLAPAHHELGILHRPGPEPMVKGGGGQQKALPPAPHPQQMEQRHGVDAPGDGAEYPATRCERKTLPAAKAFYTPRQAQS